MSEKATLLTSIPPAPKSASEGKSSLLSPTSEASTPLLTATGEPSLSSTSQSEGVAEESGQSISALQGAIYVSFVLIFCLAGFAAVALFRKASKITEARFVTAAKALAAGAGLIAFHGFFTTYLYANYLKSEGASVPLVVSIAVWALVGPAIAVVLNYLLTPQSEPEKGAIIFDACAYFAIFVSAAIALIPGIKENAALIFSLLAAFLFIIPVARSFAAFRKAKARHPELREGSEQVLIYSLLILPALLPVVVFAHACRMSDELTLFLFNFITFDFLLVAGLAMIVSVDHMSPVTAEATEETKTTEAVRQVRETVPGKVADPTEAGQPEPAVVEFSAPHQLASKKLPPRKPMKAGVTLPQAPRKPGSSNSASAAPEASNAPTRVKAPSKPKKRF